MPSAALSSRWSLATSNRQMIMAIQGLSVSQQQLPRALETCPRMSLHGAWQKDGVLVIFGSLLSEALPILHHPFQRTSSERPTSNTLNLYVNPIRILLQYLMFSHVPTNRSSLHIQNWSRNVIWNDPKIILWAKAVKLLKVSFQMEHGTKASSLFLQNISLTHFPL